MIANYFLRDVTSEMERPHWLIEMKFKVRLKMPVFLGFNAFSLTSNLVINEYSFC